ncbi:MAG: cytochrome c [Deltaproteobacteria bacterium]|nr:cytochrome c [Deltaproteobacteria bacterium]
MFVLLITAACDRSKTTWEYMPDMADTPAVKAYEWDATSPAGRSARAPIKGTIPQGFEPYPFDKPEETAGLANPLPRTAEVLARGKVVYETYCHVCHGSRGLGDGPIVPKFPKPLSLVSAQAREYSDGRIFHVITKGQNLMPSYASQLSPEQRWAAVHYVRVLQRAANPTPEDIKTILGAAIPSPHGGRAVESASSGGRRHRALVNNRAEGASELAGKGEGAKAQ